MLTKTVAEWRELVLERDNHTCIICGATNMRVVADHIVPKRMDSDLILDTDNGRTLCYSCHAKYGIKVPNKSLQHKDILLSKLFPSYKMQIVNNITVRITIPRFIVAMATRLGMPNITFDEFLERFRVLWHYSDNTPLSLFFLDTKTNKEYYSGWNILFERIDLQKPI